VETKKKRENAEMRKNTTNRFCGSIQKKSSISSGIIQCSSTICEMQQPL
jgi:hypothetical protein